MKVIKSLENRGILLKETTRKVTSQKVGFLNVLRPLLTAASPLTKSVHLAKVVLVSSGLTTAASVTDASIKKKVFNTFDTSLLANMLAGKKVIRAGEGKNRVGQDF